VRNHVLVLSPTGLTSALAQRVSLLVRGTICVTSGYGRGQFADDAKLHFDTLAGLAAHPNIAAVLVLAASQDISDSYVAALESTGKRAVGLSLSASQEDALTLVDAAVRAATHLVRDASCHKREPANLAELCIALECGHSDTTSGLACNPMVGRVAELVVEAGGQAIMSETVEWTGAEHILAKRATSAELAAKIREAVLRRERAVRAAGGDVRSQNPGPQNRAGGLTTIEEKALGAIAKGGNQPIQGLLQPAERPQGPGLFLMDTPYFSPESITAMVAGGAQIVLFTTGAGNSYCSLVAPTLKLSAKEATCSRLSEQIDISAARALHSDASLEVVAGSTLNELLQAASGKLTFGEIVGEGSEVVSRLGPSL
jgi:altronate dehydratase large subunit